MPTYIDLERRFRDLTDEELEDTEALISLGEYGFYLSSGWPELLKHSRVILFAEAGAGKTMEMEEQAKRLVEDDRHAFFVALESLDTEPFVDLLSSAEKMRFEEWKADNNQSGWFFLDSVDELKLKKGSLDRAIRHLSRAIDGCSSRARVIISCRPSDWLPGIDLATILKWLPIPERGHEVSSRVPDEVFIEPLRRALGLTNSDTQADDEQAAVIDVRKVIMLPIDDTQITLFAEQSDVENVTAFLEEIDQQNAKAFARRPLDLQELIETWTSLKRLGTREEQIETHVKSKLMDKPDKPDSGVLTNVEAQTGAERLALGLALTRTRTIRSPEHEPDVHRVDGILEPSTILVDWSDEKRRALLRRALFDPATYGRVRFHHRSVQEYLAAKRLFALRREGMSATALFHLLFGQYYGIKVVFPSMRAIAAWLSLWEDLVCKELIKREPETLLTHGGPESLSITARSDLLCTFVTAYGKGGRRGLNLQTDGIRGFADPALSPVIRKCWSNQSENDEVHKLLLKMIWLGSILDCADLAETASWDTSQPVINRVYGIRALIACGLGETVHKLADSILIEPEFWSDEVAYSLVSELFPRFITADELVALIEQHAETRRTAHNFDWVLRLIAKTIKPWLESTVTLRNKTADLIWSGRKPNLEFFDIRSKFDHLAPALAILCDRQLSILSREPDVNLIRSCVIAYRFNAGKTGEYEQGANLRAHFDKNSVLRSVSFWAELQLMDELIPAVTDWDRCYYTEHDGLLDNLTALDWTWLKAALTDESRPERRAVALYALIGLWHRGGQVATELDDIRNIVKSNSYYYQILIQRTTPPEPNEEAERHHREAQQIKTERANHETQFIENWSIWRDKLLANPTDAFSTEKQATTISKIYRWLREFKQDNSRYNVWENNALTQAFGPDIAERAEMAFRAIWRTNQPKLWSELPANERNSMSYNWIYGLVGVSVEATKPDWTASLFPIEARTAAAYASIEMNGFAPFIYDLVISHPKEVYDVVGGELNKELNIGGEHHSLPTLQKLSHADVALKRLLIPRLLIKLKSWPSDFSDQTGSHWALHLERVLRLLDSTDNEVDREDIAQVCAKRYEANLSGLSALTWLRALFRFNAAEGTRILLERLEDSKDPDTRDYAISTFAALFGDHDRIVFEIADRVQQVHALVQLVRCAYTFIRPEDDRVHEGSYTPNTRDDAESARSFLLSRLLETPGPEAHCAVMTLADEGNFSHFSDRLRLLARERAAAEAEFSPYSPKAVIALENRYEIPPNDRDSLFELMMERLEDLAQYYAYDDLSNRQTVLNITKETEMQLTLAGRLRDEAKNSYKVTREEEVANQKRTDIRLLAVNCDQKAVIEVKIADSRWSLSDLNKALRDQLVGKYLGDANCKAGCLLLTCHDVNKYWIHPETRRRIKFPALIAYLNEKAAALEEENMRTTRISVFGLDLTGQTVCRKTGL